jgi:hypothetical protein
MERYCSTGQSPWRAVAPAEEEKEYQHALSFPVCFSQWEIENFYIIFPYSINVRITKKGYFSGCLKMHKMLLPK